MLAIPQAKCDGGGGSYLITHKLPQGKSVTVVVVVPDVTSLNCASYSTKLSVTVVAITHNLPREKCDGA